MKYISAILKSILWTIALSYFALVVITHIPDFQKGLAEELAEVLTEELGTKCTVGNVRLGFLNRIIIDNIHLQDEQKKEMLAVNRLAVTPDYADLLTGKITLSAAQLFGADFLLYNKEDGTLNCQFVIDKFSNPDSKEPSKLDLRINTLVLRNISVKYNDIAVTNLKANIVVPTLKDKDIAVQIKKLAFHESHGVTLNDMNCNFEMKDRIILLSDFYSDVQLNKSEMPSLPFDVFARLKSNLFSYDLADNKYEGDVDAWVNYLRLNTNLKGVGKAFALNNLVVDNDDNSLYIKGNADVNANNASNVFWHADISNSHVAVASLYDYIDREKLPQQLVQACFLDFKGRGEGADAFGTLEGTVETAVGNLDLKLNRSRERIIASIDAKELLLGTLLSDEQFGTLTANVDFILPTKEGRLPALSVAALPASLNGAQLKGTIAKFDFQSHHFSNVQTDLTLNNNILVGTLNVEESDLASFAADMNLDVSNIANKWVLGTLLVNNLRYKNIALNQIDVDIAPDAIDLKTDMATVNIAGDYLNRHFDTELHVTDFASLDRILGLGLKAQGAIDANLQMSGDTISGTLVSQKVSLSSIDLHNIDVNFHSEGEEIVSHIKADNGNGGHGVRAELNTAVRLLDENSELCTLTSGLGNVKGVDVDVLPSKVFLRDTLFRIGQSNVSFANNVLSVNDLRIEHGSQFLIVNGKADKNSEDSIIVSLNDLDVPYILNFVKFHAVDFSGNASGVAVVKSLFSKPDAKARLTVDDFTFEGGRMGTLYANAEWNNEEGQINIDAHCDDEGHDTFISGYVSPTRNYIDLDIDARNTRGEFVGEFCKSFLSDVDVYVTGRCKIWGDLSYVNLTGKLKATGGIHVKSLGVDYVLDNQTVNLEPNEICFPNDTIIDRYGQYGVVSGQIHHQYLSRLTFDLNVLPHNLLCYDFPTYGKDIFFGKAFATGNCEIIGRPGQITFNVDANVEKGSFVEYNASNPDAITGQQFISWHNKTTSVSAMHEEDKSNFTSDIRLNINAHVTPEATLRVLMDSKSGDMIQLHGSGDLRATYFNKGAFNLFGNYFIESGSYRMTIQNFLQKNFQFQNGSQIVFGGEPYDAQLSLKAVYPVNGVPLSDLQIGNSFKNNNVHVDCIMNITGTPNEPLVDFDFDLPTVSSDANAMIHSLINSEQEVNQQVIYLLTIGRFYTQEGNLDANDAERQSQASLAMQSFLSGTISQQINNFIGSVTKNNNWNFGANISTGDDGIFNAEYEGLFNGSLLNNRLLINGQLGYRDNPNATSSFIGDFDVRYLLLPNGNVAVRVYNQTNDRYFTRSSLNTQGLGMIFKYDFNRFFNRKKKKQK